MGFFSCRVNKLLFCLQFIFFVVDGFTQTYYTSIKTFGEAEGYNITEGGIIYQDRKGFIWIASRNGLYRFDGTSFKHYKHVSNDSFSLPANQVNFCYQDKDNDYWVGVFGKGLYRFNDRTEKFTLWRNKNLKDFDISKSYNLIAPFEDSHGQFWMSAATIGVIRINKEQGTVKLFNVCDKFNPVDLFRSCRWVHQFSEDKDGWFWLSSNDGLIHFNPGDGNFKVFRNGLKEVTSYFRDSEGQHWVGTWGGGLTKLDTNAVDRKKYLWTYKTNGTTNIVTGITEKDKDHLWVSSLDAGPMLFDKRTGKFITIATQDVNEKLLGSTYIFRDGQQNIWISGKQQLVRINAHNLFNYVYMGSGDPKDPKMTSCFFHSPNDSIVFVGTIYNKEGLHAFNLKTGNIRVVKLESPRESIDVADIFNDSKAQLWIATDYGAYILNRKTLQAKRFTIPSKKYEGFFARSIVKILEDDKHRMWFASRWYGLLCFDPQTNKTLHYSSDSAGAFHIPVDQIEYAAFDKAGNLWVGTHAYLQQQPSVFCLQPNGEVTRYDNHIPLNNVFQVGPLRNKKIIVSTASLGLFEINSPLQSNEKIHRFSEDNGIADSYIEGFIEDKRGNLWITTHNGLTCMKSNGEFFNLHTEDGLANNKIEGRPYIDDAGNLFLPFDKGFQFFNVDSLFMHRTSIGPVILESLSINQKKYTGNPNYLQQLNLDYNESNISFEFSAFDLSQGDKLQYAYQLQGSDTSWNIIGNSRQLFFSNLSPGKYKLRLRAGDRFGNWSSKEFVLPVTIYPPFWKTWWFYTLCLLTAVSLIYVFYRVRLNTVLAEQKLRNKIARDLHDDIGSTLSGIKLFSNMAQTKLAEERSSALNIVERIGERSEKMIDAMSDIVWSINPLNDSLENMLVRMKQYAAEMLEPKNIAYQFIADEKLSKTKISLDARKDIYLIFKEAINNAVKHSGCNNVRIEMRIQAKNLEMVISDDGKGLSVADVKTNGNGLNNFKERAKNIGGKISVESNLLKGTTVKLVTPVT